MNTDAPNRHTQLHGNAFRSAPMHFHVLSHTLRRSNWSNGLWRLEIPPTSYFAFACYHLRLFIYHPEVHKRLQLRPDTRQQ
jgi:hypothetical protein